ncbi:YgaP family membrane protein [Halovulum sp. GXIMD14793]
MIFVPRSQGGLPVNDNNTSAKIDTEALKASGTISFKEIGHASSFGYFVGLFALPNGISAILAGTTLMSNHVTPPSMQKNEEMLDCGLRIVLLSLVFTGPKTMWGLVGLVPLLTGLVGMCPLYSILGIRTCQES